MKTIIGLFGNQEDVGEAVEKLAKQDLGENFSVIQAGKSGVHMEIPSTTSGFLREVRGLAAKGTGGKASTTVEPGPKAEFAPSGIVKAPLGDLTHRLIDRGLKNEEAEFIQESVERGGSILVLEVDKEDVSDIEAILSNARVITK